MVNCCFGKVSLQACRSSHCVLCVCVLMWLRAVVGVVNWIIVFHPNTQSEVLISDFPLTALTQRHTGDILVSVQLDSLSQ